MIDWVKQDKEQREALERGASCGERINAAAMINGLAKRHGEREMPGLGAYGVIRLMQSNGAAQAREARQHNIAHDKWLKKSADFNRLHPLSRSTPLPVQGARGSTSEARLSPQRRSTGPRSNFEIGPRDPGQREGSRFEQGERYDPPRRAKHVPDSAGRMRGGHGGDTGGEVREGVDLQAAIREALSKPVRLF